MADKEKLFAYISKLEVAIRDTMEGSEEIARIVALIQEEGVQVTLNFLALFFDTSGKPFMLKQGLPGSLSAHSSEVEGDPLEFELTEQDHEFLRQIGIRFDEPEA